MNDILSSKTMKLWLFIFAIGFAALVFATAVTYTTGLDVPALREFYALLGGGGAAGTVRNVVSDSPVRQTAKYPEAGGI